MTPLGEEGGGPPDEASKPEVDVVVPADEDSFLRAISQPSAAPPPMGGETADRRALPKAGDVLAGKYRVERVIGVGGMGVVVAARHQELDVLVALKFMTDQALPDYDEMIMRFQREARATARLRSEHVVRVSDVGRLESGAPYMVMEFLEGNDLAHLLGSVGPPPIPSAVEYAVQACEALDEAHRAGIVHRDVKPSNLFLTKRNNGTPCIKVLDFGISKAVQMTTAGSLSSTKTSTIFGSPLYMAPEQMRSARDVDRRADIWSLGATLYELLTGKVPFAAESLVDLAFRVANERPPPLRSIRRLIPRGLEAAVLRCLEKDRDKRFADIPALVDAILPFAPRRARLATEPHESEPPSSGTGVGGTLVMGLPPQPAPRPAPPPAASPSGPQLPQLTASQSGPFAPPTASPSGPYVPVSSGAPMPGGAQPWPTGSHSWGTSQQVPRASRAPLYVAAGMLPLIGFAIVGFILIRTPRASPSSQPSAAVAESVRPSDAPPVASVQLAPAGTATTTAEPSAAPVAPPPPSSTTAPTVTRPSGPPPAALPPPRPSSTVRPHQVNPLDNPN